MAKATVKKEVTVTLTLTQNEATFLCNMLQNPMCHPDEEESTVSKMRHELFHALKQAEEPTYRAPHAIPRSSIDCIADMAEFK